MGESRGGEGRAGRPTTVEIARALIKAYEKDRREITTIQVTFVTDGLYAVSIEALHEPTPERFFLGVEPTTAGEGTPTPSGGLGAPGEAG